MMGVGVCCSGSEIGVVEDRAIYLKYISIKPKTTRKLYKTIDTFHDCHRVCK